MNALPESVDAAALGDLIRRTLAEDVGSGDVTTEATVGTEVRAEARFLAKADGILAGHVVAEHVFDAVDPGVECEWTRTDGQAIYRGTVFGTAVGPARSLLTAERLVLNVMQRMSGIATATRRFVDAVERYPARILDTRKTAPGLRVLDKWAVRLGGGENHRLGLFDMILIKDNHVAAAGGISAALNAADRYRTGKKLEIEIETRTLDEVREVLETGLADRILLDNMIEREASGQPDVSRLKAAVQLIDGRIPAEASGNVTLDTVTAIARTGVPYISCGALTHSVVALEISLGIRLQSR